MYDRSYQNQILREKKPKRKADPKLKLKIFLWVMGSLIVLVGLIFLLRIKPLQVDEITISGTSVVDPNDIERLINESMSGEYLGIIPRTSAAFISTNKLERKIKSSFSRLSDISITRSKLSALTLEVFEFEGEYLWCRPGNDNCYFMDRTGTVFAPAPFFSGSAYVRLQGGTFGELPFKPFEDPLFSIIQTYNKELPNIGINPTEIIYESTYKLIINFSHQNQKSELYINPKQESDVVIGNIGTALSSEPFKSEFKGLRALDYIDSRFSNKVVYKFK